jgi:hypothetical protein
MLFGDTLRYCGDASLEPESEVAMHNHQQWREPCYIPFLGIMAGHEVTKNPLSQLMCYDLTIISTIGSFAKLVNATIVMHILFRLKAAVSDLRCSSPVPKKTAC